MIRLIPYYVVEIIWGRHALYTTQLTVFPVTCIVAASRLFRKYWISALFWAVLKSRLSAFVNSFWFLLCQRWLATVVCLLKVGVVFRDILYVLKRVKMNEINSQRFTSFLSCNKCEGINISSRILIMDEIIIFLFIFFVS